MTVFLLFAAAAVLAAVLISYFCFRLAFYAPRKAPSDPDTVEFPEGEIYVPFYPMMEKWAREVRAMPHEHFQITSFDGLELHGNFYEFSPGAPIEVMFHGYRGTAERDLSGAVQRCFTLGRSALIVDQRCSNRSGGNVITFGVREHRDCLNWVDFVVDHFGPDVKIILTGISMGASTVLMAGGHDLPKNVIGILADCGFTSARDIIQEIIPQMHIPAAVGYPFVKLGAKLFGGFDLEETSPIEMVRRCRVPVIFIHGEADDYVPCRMSRENYDACPSRKAIFTVPGAGHGLAYLVDNEGYFSAVRAFFGPEGSFPGTQPEK